MTTHTTIATTAAVRSPSAGWDMLRTAIYLGGMVPACIAFARALTGSYGADPLKSLENELGLWALRFLLIGLAITPLRKLAGINLVRYRRAIGLLAFFNAALHVLVYVWLDQNLNLAAIAKDIVKRPYIMAGMAAFTILVPLAVTSNAAMIKKLGAAAWQRLHRWVYLAAAAGCLHFILLVKRWPPEPLAYAAIATLLLGYRLYDRTTRKDRRSRAA